MLEIILPIPAFNDNYIWLIKKPNHDKVVCIDPGEAEPVLSYLKSEQLTLSHILITHHHFDHIGGVPTLKSHFPDLVTYGPIDPRISKLDHIVKEGDQFEIKHLDLKLTVIETPGHTKTHICFHIPSIKALFCGDTLFSAGCGRLFEGTPEDMASSLKKLSALPKDTRVFCAHEYTRQNLMFADTIEPGNQDVIKALNALAPDSLSLPSTLEKEFKINPFLRCDKHKIIETARQHDNTIKNETDTFRVIRKLKDNF